MSKENYKFKKELDAVFNEAKSILTIIEWGEKHTILVKGNPVDINKLLFYLMESDSDFYEILKASIESYEEYKQFKNKNFDEKLDTLIEMLKKLDKDVVKKVLN